MRQESQPIPKSVLKEVRRWIPVTEIEAVDDTVLRSWRDALLSERADHTVFASGWAAVSLGTFAVLATIAAMLLQDAAGNRFEAVPALASEIMIVVLVTAVLLSGTLRMAKAGRDEVNLQRVADEMGRRRDARAEAKEAAIPPSCAGRHGTCCPTRLVPRRGSVLRFAGGPRGRQRGA